ncbi:MAG: polysaccharide biosynthesis C-terminal domain-containing protein [Chitinophagaceae bacterium]
MGIIKKQSIKSSIFIFIGFAIGGLNMLVLFPRFLTQDELGLTRAMIEISLTLSTLCTLGSVSVIYKFFPYYNAYLEEKKNDLPLVTAAVCLIGFLLVLLAGFIFKDLIIRKLGKSPGFAAYFYTVYPFTLFLLLFTWLEAFSWSFKRTVITSFLRETGVRVVSTLLILLYGFHIISIKGFINLFSLLHLIPALLLLFILLYTSNWRFYITSVSSVTKRLKSRMISFGMFVFVSHFLNVLSKTNDTILIIGLRGLADTGVFAIASYIIAVMEIPQRSLGAISTPVLSEAWKNYDLKNIELVYKKSVANLLVIGLILFGLIILNVHNVTGFLGKNYEQVELIVLIMGIAKILDLGTGINSLIIGTSNHWKFDFYTNIIYTLMSLPLNFFLIKHFGLKGVAFASLISLTIYNAIRFSFLYFKFGFQPYTIKSLLAILLAAVNFYLIYLIPRFPNVFIDTFIRSLVLMITFVPLIYILNIAPDLNSIVINVKNQLFNRTRQR